MSEFPPRPDYFPIDQARYLPVEARTDELDQLEDYVDANEGYIDEAAIRRHIIARRAAIVAIGVRRPDAVVAPPAETEVVIEDLSGRTIEQWHTFLTGDNLDVPCSRYGRNASEVSWAAIACLIIFQNIMGRYPDDVDEFADNAMSMVVNDDSEMQHLIKDHLDMLPKEVLEQLNMEDWDE